MLNNTQNTLLEDKQFRNLFDISLEPVISAQSGNIDVIIKDYVSSLELSNPHSSELKKCDIKRGKWQVIANKWDFTCGVYDAIEIVRHAILSARQSDKHSVELALVYSKYNPKYYYLVNINKQNENYIDIDKLKKIKAFSHHSHHQCSCDAGFSEKVFSQIVEPGLTNLMNIIDYKISPIVLKKRLVKEQSGPFSSVYYQRDLKGIRIEWGLCTIFSHLPKPPEELRIKNENHIPVHPALTVV